MLSFNGMTSFIKILTIGIGKGNYFACLVNMNIQFCMNMESESANIMAASAWELGLVFNSVVI